MYSGSIHLRPLEKISLKGILKDATKTAIDAVMHWTPQIGMDNEDFLNNQFSIRFAVTIVHNFIGAN